MNWIKNNKLLFACIVVFAVLILSVLIILIRFTGGNNVSEYGDRLKGIEKVGVTDKQIKKLKEELGNNEKVNKVTYDLKGRLINVILDVKCNIDEAKNLGNSVLQYFDDEEKKFYDIQIFLKNDADGVEGFPIIGYKHKSKDGISWD